LAARLRLISTAQVPCRPSDLQNQVDLGTGRRAVETGHGSTRGGRDQVLDREALPTWAGDRVPEQVLVGFDVQQDVREAAVPNIGLRGFDETLAQVGMEGRQAAHQEQIDQQIAVAAHRRCRDTQARGQARRVEQGALVVRQHGPETPQGLRWDARSEHRHIALQVGADKALPQLQAIAVRGREETIGKSAAQPERREVARLDLAGSQRQEVHVGDTSGQALPGLPQKVDGRRAQDEEASRAVPSAPSGVDDPAQSLEQGRNPVDLVEDDELVGVLAEEEHGSESLSLSAVASRSR
jgi:hypothetical protein